MYIIRFQKLQKRISLKYKIIVIKRGSAPNSQRFVDLLGYYNKDSNLIKIKMDLFYK
jgi:ribosomal protein S16